MKKEKGNYMSQGVKIMTGKTIDSWPKLEGAHDLWAELGNLHRIHIRPLNVGDSVVT